MPLSGIRPSDAVKCVDGFIKSHLYHLNKIGGNELIRDDVRRKAAIILGAARAVMTTDFDIAEADLEPAETETPVLHATVGESNGAKYTILLAQNDPHRDILTENLALTEDELVILKVVMRSAQTIMPLQGLNLIIDGYHYLSNSTKSSYSAFLAVERQVWVPKAFKTFADANKDIVRDLMGHKAGHPVSVSIKELAATSPAVKTKLESAKLGSASVRLPALENDAVAAQTILKLSEVVSPIWETMGGSMSADAIRIRLQIVHGVARGTARYMPPVKLDNNITIETRKEALNELKRVVKASSHKVAVAYGFYCAMAENLPWRVVTQPLTPLGTHSR
uniref:Uncharacterized protein n=1 Tax=Nicotiana tabacum TaxID=4097 RepID=A0A1S4BN99_TOBAC|nr:PREDICTED: uncharacterized protein LOC107810109 [Nicotiana tabacum]